MLTHSIRGVLVGLALAAALPAGADTKSDAVIARARKAVAAARTLQAGMTIDLDAAGAKQNIKVSLRLMRPNMLDYTLSAPFGTRRMISDGKTAYAIMPDQKAYMSQSAPTTHQDIFPIPSSPVRAFLFPDKLGTEGKHRYAGTLKRGKQVYQIVELTAADPPRKRKLLFGPSGLLEGVEMSDKDDTGVTKMVVRMTNIRLNVPFKAQQFAWAPPADFSTQKGPEDTLLPEGKDAPDFLLPTPGGGQLALEQARKDKKAVLVNFWFHG